MQQEPQAPKRRETRTKEQKRVLAEVTTRIAKAQQEEQRRLRDAKTARLRQLRMENESDRP